MTPEQIDDLVDGAAEAMSLLSDFGQGNGRNVSLLDEAYAHLHWMHDVLAEEAHRITRRDGRDKVVTDAKTVWLYTYARGFNWHECWSDENDRDDFRTAERHYLPTAKRLRDAAGGDWY